jgi:hypothetical protein
MVIERVLPATLERNMLFVAARSAAEMSRAN